ncbi:MAG TPA: hypothetical protein PK264_07610 [Hyphomicrobiaceae bacterium]|nr:hypothetical protein [Hyphomicrobiaceae bacterium]
MLKSMMAALVAAGAVTIAVAADASAHERRASRTTDSGAVLTEHPKAGTYRRGPRVKGFVARRGGYSYSWFDSINTYGSSRTVYGGTFLYRDPMMDRQTGAGPFDHGFFFDSGVGPRGGDSPYMH